MTQPCHDSNFQLIYIFSHQCCRQWEFFDPLCVTERWWREKFGWRRHWPKCKYNFPYYQIWCTDNRSVGAFEMTLSQTEVWNLCDLITHNIIRANRGLNVLCTTGFSSILFTVIYLNADIAVNHFGSLCRTCLPTETLTGLEPAHVCSTH